MNPRKKKFSFTLAAALLFFAGSCRDSQFALEFEMDLQERELENGLHIVMVEDPSVPMVSFQSWFRVGSADEKPGKTGLAHLFEHLMFNGTEKHGPNEFTSGLEAKGAEVNAYTTRDYTVFYVNATPELLPGIIEMEADRLANLKIDEQAFKLQRQIIFEERRLKLEASPMGIIDEALWRLAFEVHPYGNSISGYPEDLLRLKISDLSEFFKTYYRASNLTLVIVGNFDASKTMERIQAAYGRLPKLSRPERDFPAEPPQNSEHRFRIHYPVSSQQFKRAYHITSAHQADTYALDLLDKILFHGKNSRVRRMLVEEKKVALSVSGLAFTPSFPGLFTMAVVMKENTPAQVGEAHLDEVIREVQTHGVTEEELKSARRQFLVELFEGVNTPALLAQTIGTVTTILGSMEKFREDLSHYYEVTAKDIQRVARKYLDPNNRSTVVMLPENLRPQKDSPKK